MPQAHQDGRRWVTWDAVLDLAGHQFHYHARAKSFLKWAAKPRFDMELRADVLTDVDEAGDQQSYARVRRAAPASAVHRASAIPRRVSFPPETSKRASSVLPPAVIIRKQSKKEGTRAAAASSTTHGEAPSSPPHVTTMARSDFREPIEEDERMADASFDFAVPSSQDSVPSHAEGPTGGLSSKSTHNNCAIPAHAEACTRQRCSSWFICVSLTGRN